MCVSVVLFLANIHIQKKSKAEGKKEPKFVKKRRSQESYTDTVSILLDSVEAAANITSLSSAA